MKSKKFVKGRGNAKNPEFLIFGEAPGKKENELGKPFVGRSGNVLDNWLLSAKVSDYFIDNVFPYMPTDKDGKIRKPSVKELNENRDHVLNNIKKISPRYIITLGDSAASSLLGLKTKDLIGRIEQFCSKATSGVYHPARYIRQGSQNTDGLRDFKKTVSLLRKSNS